MSKKQQFDWLNVIDLNRAVASATTEMYGDWLRDPWGWPELEFLQHNPDAIVDRLQAGRSRFERMAVPKTNFGTRPAVVQDPTDRLAFHGVVGAISTRLATDMRDLVFGWRLHRTNPQKGQFLRNQQEWLAFIAKRREAIQTTRSFLATDITNFFGSIDFSRIVDMTYRKAGNTKPAGEVERVLQAFGELSDRSGIPQRSSASAMLANAFLAPIDDVLANFARNTPGCVPLRWMDDVWVIGGDHDSLRRLQLDLQDEFRQIGLEINLGKTTIREGDDAIDFLDGVDMERNPPAQNDAMSGAPFVAAGDDGAVDKLMDAFAERPESMDRTVIRYLCTRESVQESTTQIARLVELAPRAPQGADHLARLFARTGAWRDLQGWWTDLVVGPVGLERLPWPATQLGTMFPSDEPADEVSALLAGAIEPGNGIPVETATLAAHRLPKWMKGDARFLLRTLGERSDSPLCRRAAAIALHNAGEERARVDRILAEFEENRSTREMLVQAGRTAIPESHDFDLAART